MLVINGSWSTRTNATNECTNIKAVFARGSGQPLGRDEYKEFASQLDDRFSNSNVSISYYELGTAKQHNYQYPAVSVSDPWMNAVDAKMSSGEAYAYGTSVFQGDLELLNYLMDTTKACPDTWFFLAGYSQGAQVVGDASALFPRPLRDKILSIALFGDPKLNLPEGKGKSPAACQYEKYSIWRRNVPSCTTNTGSLGARSPYMPASLAGKTGVWCNLHDYICGSSNLPGEQAGHAQYKDLGGAIDDAVNRLAVQVSETFPKMRIDVGNLVVDPLARYETGDDVMLVVDLTAAAAPSMATTRSQMDKIINQTFSQNGRVGIETFTAFAPLEDDISWRYNIGSEGYFTFYDAMKREDLQAYMINRQVPGLAAGDYQPSDNTKWLIDTAIQQAEDNPVWRPGANRKIVYFVSLPYSEQQAMAMAAMRTKQMSVRAADTSTPEIYIVAPSNVIGSYAAMAQQNPGTTLYNLDDGAAQDQLLGVLSNPPQQDTTTDPSTQLQPPQNLQVEKTGSSTIKLSWDSGDAATRSWLVTLNGVAIGRTSPQQLSAEIDDVDFSKDNEYGVAALTDDMAVGGRTSIVMKAETAMDGTVNNTSDTSSPSSADEGEVTAAAAIQPAAITATSAVPLEEVHNLDWVQRASSPPVIAQGNSGVWIAAGLIALAGAASGGIFYYKWRK